MTPTIPRLTLAAALVLGTAATAMAQSYQVQSRDTYVDPRNDPEYNAQWEDYQARQQDYENRTADYQSRRNTYAYQRDQYADQQDRYAADRNRYLRDKADYDARYGAGAWDRAYSWRDGYVYRRGPARDYYASNPCERRAGGNTATGGLIGALAGAAIGSSVAGRGDHTEGAVIGGVLGAVVGSSVASSSNRAACDSTGYYYTYNQTVPYREGAYYSGRNSGRYDYNYYRRSRCRLAVAPTYYGRDTEYRYVRVCPDRQGRYRITG